MANFYLVFELDYKIEMLIPYKIHQSIGFFFDEVLNEFIEAKWLIYLIFYNLKPQNNII